MLLINTHSVILAILIIFLDTITLPSTAPKLSSTNASIFPNPNPHFLFLCLPSQQPGTRRLWSHSAGCESPVKTWVSYWLLGARVSNFFFFNKEDKNTIVMERKRVLVGFHGFLWAALWKYPPSVKAPLLLVTVMAGCPSSVLFYWPAGTTPQSPRRNVQVFVSTLCPHIGQVVFETSTSSHSFYGTFG